MSVRDRRIAGHAAALASLASAIVLLPILTTNAYYLRVATMVAITLILTSSLNLIYGYAGQISLGHVAFYAVGAYVTALGTTRYDLSFWLAWLGAVSVAVLLGWLVGKPVLRMQHFYLAVATLGFAVVVYVVINRWNSVTGGPVGVLGIRRPSLFGNALDDPREFFTLTAVTAAVCLMCFRFVLAAPFGRRLLAIREGDTPVASLGIDPSRWKLVAFVVSAGLAGLAGGLFAAVDMYIGPGSFHVEHSILLLAVLVVGGLGRQAGAVFAALLLVVLPEAVRGAGENQHLLFAAALLGATLFMPDGVAGALARLSRWGFSKARDARAIEAPVDEAPAPDDLEFMGSGEREPGEVILDVHDLTVSFGAFRALHAMEVSVAAGELVGLIGANGAGKSTFINAVTGVVAAERGTVRIEGTDVTGWPMHRVAQAGVVRTFQTARLFTELTVEENVRVAAEAHGTTAQVPSLLRLVGLSRDAGTRAGTLPFGRRRLLEVARALAAQPRVLLLDEPAAGLNEAETQQLGSVLERLRDAGLAVLLIEHDLALVLRISDRVVAMGFGERLAEGTPDEVVRHPDVISAYLGGTSAGGAATSPDNPPATTSTTTTNMEDSWSPSTLN